MLFINNINGLIFYYHSYQTYQQLNDILIRSSSPFQVLIYQQNIIKTMRIFLSFNHNMLHSKTERVSLPNITTTDQLINQIKKRLTVQQQFYIKFNIEGQNVRVVPGWDLKHYGIKQGASLNLQFYQSPISSMLTPQKPAQAFTMPPQSLGNLEKIEEQDVDEEEEAKTVKSSVLEHSEEEQTLQNQKMDNYLQRLLKAAKTGELDEVRYILENNQELVNEFGESGWALIHYVVYYNHIHILDYLISLRASLNLVTSEGWTPLQLTIKKQNFKMFEKLVNTKGVNLNQVTEKGTALHMAVKANLERFVQLLIQHKVDDNIKDVQKKTAVEVSQNQQISKMLLDYKKKNSIEERGEEKQKTVEDTLAIYKGIVYRQRFLTHAMKQNYMVCDPFQGTLVKYEKKEDYPKKPKEVIPLLEVTNIQIMKKQDKSLLMKKGYNFIEIHKPDKMILATKAYNCAVRWVQVIFEAATYVHKHNELVNNVISSNIKTIQIYDVEDQSRQIEQIEDTSFKKQKSPSKPTLKKSTSVFSEHIETSSAYKKVNSLGDQPKVHFDATATQPGSQKNKEVNLFKETQITKADQNQKQKSEPASNYSSFASSGKKQNFSTMAEEIKIGISSFDIIKEVGSGSFGKVYLAKLRRTKEIFALKALKKSTLILKKQLKYAIGQVNILKKLYSPFILQLHYAFQTPHYLYLCLDYCPFGDLSQYLMNQEDGVLDEDEARSIIAQLIIAVEHMHSLNIIYRDMKPENVLIGADGYIRLADFGLSKGDVANNLCVSFCGSPAYLSPQMLKQKGVGKESDVYGLGCILYEMLVGEPPYYDDDMEVLYQNIQKGNLKFTGRMSNEAKEIIQLLLERNPIKRINLQNMKKHAFFKGINFEKLERKEIGRLNVRTQDIDEESDEEIQVLDSKKPTFFDADYPDDKKINRVNNFSFIRNSA